MLSFWPGSASGTKSAEKDQPETTFDPDFLVKWDRDDPLNPQNWPVSYKWWITFQLGMLALAGSLGSSIMTPADNIIAKYVGVSSEVAVLDVTMYLLGFVSGPLIWAPVSEIWGRRVSILPAVFCQAVFAIATARSTNAAAFYCTRFFAGFFGSAPISNVTAALGDIWSRETRGIAVSMYAVAVNGGPALGPIIGAAIVLNPHLDWRWTGYILAIWIFVTFTMAFFFLPELSRPIKMLFAEPIVTCIAVYASFVYGVMYLTLEVFPIVFQEIRGWNPLIGSLPFLALLIGVISSVGLNIWNQYRYNRIAKAANGKAVPEARLPPMAFGAVFFVVGAFWFAWTAKPPHHWILPCLAALFIGVGFNCIFQQCLNFLVDVYGLYAASSTAAVTFLRSIMAAGLPLAAKPMINALGVGPGVSIIGAVAAVLLPIPFLFMKYGPRLRSLSKLVPESH